MGLARVLFDALWDPAIERPRFGRATFDYATFASEARFEGAVFAAEAGFKGTVFGDDAWFDNATESTAILRLRYGDVDLSDAVITQPIAVTAHTAPFPSSGTPSSPGRRRGPTCAG
ncbi:pentapeptide repeat-containing protein [Streptomyces sp. DSM 116496]|uniref:pentapeptide repeat-containing protein n=1 Tax=Streptomyces stoeckheimensis TaxID=3344656 RepID=UPI0038B2D909